MSDHTRFCISLFIKIRFSVAGWKSGRLLENHHISLKKSRFSSKIWCSGFYNLFSENILIQHFTTFYKIKIIKRDVAFKLTDPFKNELEITDHHSKWHKRCLLCSNVCTSISREIDRVRNHTENRKMTGFRCMRLLRGGRCAPVRLCVKSWRQFGTYSFVIFWWYETCVWAFY